MFGWLTRLFSPRDSRQLFRFWDGQRFKLIDPVVAASGLETAAGEEWPQLLKIMAMQPPPVPAGVEVGKALADLSKTKRDAAEKIAKAACQAFGVEEFVDTDGTPTGLTIPERVALVTQFFYHLSRLAEAARPFSNTSSPMEASPAA